MPTHTASTPCAEKIFTLRDREKTLYGKETLLCDAMYDVLYALCHVLKPPVSAPVLRHMACESSSSFDSIKDLNPCDDGLYVYTRIPVEHHFASLLF